MPIASFNPGFRLSVTDVIVLFIGAAASLALAMVDGWIAVAVAFVVVHFFLFCNVLRMSRPLELIWAGTFAALAMMVVTFNTLSWPTVFAACATLTIVLAVIESRRPSYHGVGWRRINPKLPQWWEAQQTNASQRK